MLISRRRCVPARCGDNTDRILNAFLRSSRRLRSIRCYLKSHRSQTSPNHSMTLSTANSLLHWVCVPKLRSRRRILIFIQPSAALEQTHLIPSRILSLHARYYVREMRILAYAQILESYRSLTLQSMSTAFGVSVDFIDKYVHTSTTTCAG